MAIIPRLIARYAIVLYAFFAAGALFYLGAALRARRKHESALFALEREDAASQSLRAWMMTGVCLLLSLGVYGVSSFVVPNLPNEETEDTSIIAFLSTPAANPALPTGPAATLAPTATFASVPTIAPIATPLARAPDTPAPLATAEGDGPPLPAACTSAGTKIVSPRNGDRLSGVVEVLGTASLPNFSFYKFEIQWPDNEEWITVQSFDQPVAGGVLGTWDTRPLAQQPGTYKFRLVVVDDTSNFPEPCVITVVIE